MTERRYTQTALEVRDNESGQVTLYGYAAKYDSPSDADPRWTEVIKPGAFDKTVSGDIRCLFDHDSSKLLGRTTAGNLVLKLDNIGLYFEVTLPNTATANEVAELVRQRILTGCSFGFNIAEGGMEWSEASGKKLVEITDVILHEVSIVTWPYYEETEVNVRSAIEALIEKTSPKKIETPNLDRAKRLLLVNSLS